MKNVLFFQYGDFAEAYKRLRNGGVENYRDQKYSVDYVEKQSENGFNITVLCVTSEPHDVQLSKTLRSVGITKIDAFDCKTIQNQLSRFDATLFICRTPNLHALRWAKKNNIRTLPLFADIFQGGSIKLKIKNFMLRKAMEGGHINCFSNHSLNASKSMLNVLKLSAKNIVPWDWNKIQCGDEVKVLSKIGPFTVFYAGALTELKGVGDCLRACSFLKKQNFEVNFQFAGGGEVEKWRDLVEKLEISNNVEFLGMIPNQDVAQRMKSADAVIVPSRHEYPEGLPNTIYEGLASASPLIISDHPAFPEALSDKKTCMRFKASEAEELSKSIVELFSKPDVYTMISQNSKATLDKMYFGINWADLVGRFLDDPENGTSWVERNSISALGVESYLNVKAAS